MDNIIEHISANGTNIASLYDENYLRSLQQQSTASSINLNTLYNNPNSTDPQSFTETLRKVGKTDLSVKYFSRDQLYNQDGRYQWGYNDNYYNQVTNNGSSSRYHYILQYNSYSNITTNQIASDDYLGRLSNITNGSNGVINPLAGSPIRLKAPNGFEGYLNCLTKNWAIYFGLTSSKINLSSAPSNLSDNVSIETATNSAIGRSQGFNFFSNVGSRQVSFSFEAYADYLPAPFNDVLSYCKALKKMNYPTYSSDIVNSPVVTFVYGGLSITGIPNITFTFDNTIRKGLIDRATISVQITETDPIVDGEVHL